MIPVGKEGDFLRALAKELEEKTAIKRRREAVAAMAVADLEKMQDQVLAAAKRTLGGQCPRRQCRREGNTSFSVKTWHNDVEATLDAQVRCNECKGACDAKMVIPIVDISLGQGALPRITTTPQPHITARLEPACDTCGDTGTHMDARMYPRGHTEVEVYCIDCGGDLAGKLVGD